MEGVESSNEVPDRPQEPSEQLLNLTPDQHNSIYEQTVTDPKVKQDIDDELEIQNRQAEREADIAEARAKVAHVESVDNRQIISGDTFEAEIIPEILQQSAETETAIAETDERIFIEAGPEDVFYNRLSTEAVVVEAEPIAPEDIFADYPVDYLEDDELIHSEISPTEWDKEDDEIFDDFDEENSEASDGLDITEAEADPVAFIAEAEPTEPKPMFEYSVAMRTFLKSPKMAVELSQPSDEEPEMEIEKSLPLDKIEKTVMIVEAVLESMLKINTTEGTEKVEDLFAKMSEQASSVNELEPSSLERPKAVQGLEGLCIELFEFLDKDSNPEAIELFLEFMLKLNAASESVEFIDLQEIASSGTHEVLIEDTRPLAKISQFPPPKVIESLQPKHVGHTAMAAIQRAA